MAENSKCCDCCASCGCVGYAYVPVQELCETYDACTALERGSLFPELDLTIDEYGEICKEKGGVC